MSIACTHSISRSAEYIGPIRKTISSDEALIERMARADQAALRTLAERHYACIYRFVLRFLSDRDAAEDVVNETLLAAWQQASRFENRSSVRTWLLAIARYRALATRKRSDTSVEPLDERAAAVFDPSDQPDIQIARADSTRYLQRCVSALPVEQAALIELVYYRGTSVKEAAAIAGIPVNTVKTRLFLARKKLAALLAAEEAEARS